MEAFNELYGSINWRDFKEEIEYHMFVDLNKSVRIDQNTDLSLHCNDIRHIKFIEDTNSYIHPGYK